MKIERINPEGWAILSESAHRSVFNKEKPAHFDRIDYALLALGDTGDPLGYLTAREQDHETVYWQFGGSFPGVKGTIHSWSIYQAFIRWTKEAGYKRISTLVENTNIPYLKFCMKAGFFIVGIRNFKGTVLLEHLLEL